MNKSLLRALAVLIGTLAIATSQANANSCVDIFKTQNEKVLELVSDSIELSGVKIIRDTSPQEVTSKRDPRYNESVKNLLMMLTETQFENISKRDLFERGDLRLGKMFDDGMSLEFVYEGDLRANNDHFFLKKIILIKPNGQSQEIDNSPLPDLGKPQAERTIVVKKEKLSEESTTVTPLPAAVTEQLLSKELQPIEIKEKAASLEARLREVKIPYKIEGVVLDSLRDWSKIVPQVSRKRMRNHLEKDHVRRLAWEGQALRAVRFAGQQTNRIVFRGILKAAIVVGLFYNVALPIVQDKFPNVGASHAPTAQVVKDVSRENQVIDLIAELSRAETEKDGSPLIYTGKKSDSHVLRTAQTKDSQVLISLFPKQEKIVIVPDSKSAEKLAPVILNRVDNPRAYDFIADQMEDLYAGRR